MSGLSAGGTVFYNVGIGGTASSAAATAGTLA
jgi:hypothetical protein